MDASLARAALPVWFMATMQTYELLYLAPLQQSDDARATIRDRVTRVVQDAGGLVAATREFARQRLSYPINRHDAGEYTIVEFTAAADAPAKIGRELRVASDLLRHLITVKNERARVVGAEIASRERAESQQSVASGAAPSDATRPAEPPPEPKAIENLDQRLEEILGKEMV